MCVCMYCELGNGSVRRSPVRINTNNPHDYKWMRPYDLIFGWTFPFTVMLACWPYWRAGHWSCTTGCHWRTWCRHSSARLQHSQNAPWPRRVQRSKSSVKEAEEEWLSFSTALEHLGSERRWCNLWFEHPLGAAGVIQTDALVHCVIRGEIVAHLVTVAASFILRPTVSAALCLRRFLQTKCLMH